MPNKRCGSLSNARWLSLAMPFLTGAMFLVLANCTTSGPSRPQLSQPPRNLEPHRVILGLIGSVADTDNNRYPDSIAVMVFIYGNHAVPITPLGTFTFRLLKDDNEEVVRWEISEESAQAAVSNRNLAGPAFTFRLDIRDHISDRMEPVSLRLAATFSPTGGKPLHAVGPGFVQFGRDGG